MDELYFIRHGNRPNIFGDPSLSELGIKQAQLTAGYLTSKSITQIYSSPFKRALETASIIARRLNIKNVKIDARLVERFNWGDDLSQSFDEFISEWQKTTMDRDYRSSTGDSSRTAGKRMKALIDEIITDDGSKEIVLVSHGGAIADLLRNLFNDNFLESFRPDFLEAGIPECSITKLVVGVGLYDLKDFAYSGHLDARLK